MRNAGGHLLFRIIIAVALALFAGSFPARAQTGIYDWTGFYAGFHAGGGWGQKKGTDYSFSPLLNTSQQSFGGGFGGMQLGYNAQFGRMVWGSELSASYGSISNSGECIFDAILSVGADCKTKIDWSLRLLGRLGYAYGDGRFLPYVVAGAVMSNIRADYSNPGESWGGTRITPGTAIGAGFEYAFGNGYSFGLEYLYVRYFNQNYSGFSSCGCESIADQNANAHTVRVSLNYTFGSPPRELSSSPAASRDTAIYDWTGFYVGASGSKDWSTHKGGEIALAYVDRQKFGAGGGGLQFGYNYQVSRFVWGAEFSGSLLSGGSTSDSCYLPGTITCSAKEEWTARLLGRFGYAMGDGAWLPYVTGGIAMTRLKLGWDGGAFVGAYSARANMIGVVFGGGLQYAFRNGWSAGVEYLFTAYGNQDFSSMGAVFLLHLPTTPMHSERRHCALSPITSSAHPKRMGIRPGLCSTGPDSTPA